MSRHDEDEHASGEGRIKIGNYTAGDIALFKDIADASADSTAKKIFVQMGLDPSQPLVSQRYFQVLRELTEHSEAKAANDAWVNRWRPRTEGLFGKVAAVVLGASVLGALNTFWTGFKSVITTASLPPHLP
jgi:hypothetical protein